MLSAGASPQWSWSDVDVAVPRPGERLPGVRMAGFHQRGAALFEIAMVAYPAVTLFFDLNEAIRYDLCGRRERGSVAVGLLPGQFRASGRGIGDCLQIRLDPAVAAAVLAPAADLTGRTTALEDVWGRGVAGLEDRLRATPTWDGRFTIVNDVLRARMAARVDPEVAQVWRRTSASHGRVQVEGLADEVGWSRKRLWSRFRTQLGITPKRAAQLVRFDHAAHLLAAGHAAAGVATASGYADQSHLIREVKAFTGATPAVVAAAPWLGIDHVAWPLSFRHGPQN